MVLPDVTGNSRDINLQLNESSSTVEEQEAQHLDGAPIASHLAESVRASSRDDEACLGFQ